MYLTAALLTLIVQGTMQSVEFINYLSEAHKLYVRSSQNQDKLDRPYTPDLNVKDFPLRGGASIKNSKVLGLGSCTPDPILSLIHRTCL